MSDLQLSLMVIGVVVIGAVGLYNWLQERSYRRGLQEAFGSAPDDVLLGSGVDSALADGRLEPQLIPREESGEPGTGGAAVADPVHPASSGSVDTILDYAAEIEADGPVPDSMIGELTSRVASCGKPVHLAGLDAHTGAWEDVARGRGTRFRRFRLTLQMVNRSGAVNAAQLAAFCDAIRIGAERMSARASCPDTQAALRNARELDAFCAEVDVAIGINVIAPDGAEFPGNRIRAAAEAAGFKLEPDGVFHFRNERGQTLFTLDNHEPAPFLPESIKGLSTRGITLLLDVPRVTDGPGTLDRMLGVADHLATMLGGSLADDNRAPLSEPGVARIREQVKSIHGVMESHGIPAGSPRALRLFS
jgi:hypothetical protein